MVIDRIAAERDIRLGRRGFRSRRGQGKIGSEEVLLFKPQTFMNCSGQAVREIVKFHNLPLKDVLIICDDLNLPLGKIRLRRQGTDGGHKGLKSIINSLGKKDFPRLRLGIGTPPSDLVADKYVLSRFPRADRPTVEEAVSRAVECVLTWIYYDAEEAMNRFNA